MLRAAGELTILPAALTTYAGASVTAGEFTQAAHLLEQSDAISAATSAPPHRSVRIYLAACLGQEQQAEQLAQATIQEATERGEGSEVTIALFALTFLRNGLAHYEQAFTACTAALAYDDVGMHGHLLNEMVEAATRSARRDIAESAAGELIERAAASPTRTALGYAARAKAILDSEPSAETEYLTAITELDKTPLDVLAARTHLIFGEWLRRANRRAEASSRLRTAYEMFRQMGADGFAERARRELHAAGEPQRKERDDTSMVALTSQESYIARLAGDGYTNSEIAGHLFLSPRTVEWHLSKIFVKLGVSSRRDLRRLRGERP